MTSNNNIKLGANHIWLPYTQMKNHLPQLEVESAKGSKIFLKNGKELIDGISSWWSVSHGYQHPHIVSAITRQAKKLCHVMLAGCANDETYELSHRLCKFAEMDRVFFSDSGSTAVEVAMKMAWQFHINARNPEKVKFVSFKNSYHGDTTGAMSLADLSGGMHKKFEKILLENISLNLPKTAKDLEKFDQFLEKNKNKIAGIFVEPLVQCAGGMKFYDPKILSEIFRISKKHQIIFIADECAVGFYRTGKKFAFNHAKITPDILILGKALTGGTMTLAATLVKKDIFNKFSGNTLDIALMHGPTFMGNALACSAANASLDLFEKIDYEKKTAEIAKFLTKELEKCRDLKNVKDVRILGAIGVIEIKTNWEEIIKLRKKFIKAGVFLRPFADVIYVMPPLNISKKDLKNITDVISQVLT
jgi:adenosylmethionine-8-amino-7-oxononanoate aminotransferase